MVTRFEASGGAPLSIAIDGRWGSGKTFFVERWMAQLRANRLCVIEFDAWQHDQAGDPALAFMSEISRQVKDQTTRVIDTAATAREIESALSDTMASMKRAIKPVGKALLSATVKKLVGMSVDEIAEAATGGEAENEYSEKIVSSAFDQAVAKYLDQIMADHELRHASVKKFRENLERLASSLAKASEGPVFVVIDELDRCRPSFAIQLLEGVKHLFSVRNVCFVFSTNLSQLAASIQAVYGPHFNGRDYLGRFFDQELRLPLPSGDQFARLLFQQSNSASKSRRLYGSFYFPAYHKESRGVEVWAGICQALGVTLRQQQQAYTTFLFSCDFYPSNAPIPALWLAFLSLLHRSYPLVFETLLHAQGPEWDYRKFADTLKQTAWTEQSLQHSSARLNDQSGKLSLSELLFWYFSTSKVAVPAVYDHIRTARTEIRSDLQDVIVSGRDAQCTLHLPFDVVSTAGLFSQENNDHDQ